MGRNFADVLWEMLEKAGVKRCYGIVGDALNPVIDALHRNGNVEFVHVRNEEYGVFAAVAEAYFTAIETMSTLREAEARKNSKPPGGYWSEV
ncbi:MAG: thiamine pyrophosphate-binding protein [Candidatus Acidiferrales bacterium]